MDSQEDIVKGELYSWGWNNGQLGHEAFVPNSDTEEKSNANVYRPQKVPNQPEEFKTRGIKIIACGASHNVVITTDDDIYVFGRNQKFSSFSSLNLKLVLATDVYILFNAYLFLR